jgi:hypothetical protein
MMKNMQKIPFGEGQVQDPIPALPGHGSKIPAVPSSLGVEMWCEKNREQTDGRTDRRIDGQTDRRRQTDGQRNDFNRTHFFLNVL